MKYKSLSIYKIFFIALLFIFMQSCGSSKNVVSEKKPKEKSLKFLQKKLDKQNSDFEYFSSKAKVNYKSNEIEQQFTSYLRLKKDSAIWVSIYALGMVEIGRVLIDKENVQILDRVNKKYYKRDFSIVQNYIDYPIDFEMLQNALLGNPLYDINQKNPQASVSGNYYFLENLINKVNNRVWINPSDYTITKTQLYDEENKRRLDVLLNNFEKFNKGKFSKEREIKVLNNQIAYNIKIDYSRLDFKKTLNFPFTVPPKFEKDDGL